MCAGGVQPQWRQLGPRGREPGRGWPEVLGRDRLALVGRPQRGTPNQALERTAAPPGRFGSGRQQKGLRAPVIVGILGVIALTMIANLVLRLRDMARPLRIDLAGGWYHVTARGIERRAIFRDDCDRAHFLELLEAAVTRFGIVVHAYVLMDNHYHLVVETPAANLSAAMQWVNVSYSVWFNRRRGRVGHVFQGRFAAVVAEPGAYAVELSRYVHLNPVRVKRLGLDKAAQGRARAGLATKRPAAEVVRERVRRLRGYPWSSYQAYGGWTDAPAWLTIRTVLTMFGGGAAPARREQYREFVEAPVREGWPVSPWDRLEAGMLLGGKEFVTRLRRLARGNIREQPALRQMARRPGVAEVVAAVERAKGTKWAEFRDQHGDWGRDAVLWLARMSCGLKLRELAAYSDMNSGAAVAYAVKRFADRLAHDVPLRQTIEAVRTKLLNVKGVLPKG